MKPPLKDLAARLYGVSPPPTARLSFLVGNNPRQVQYWLSGRDPAPDDVIELLEQQLSALQSFDLPKRIDELVGAAGQAGIDDQILMYYLHLAVEKLKDRGNNP